MLSVHFNSPDAESRRRARLYGGSIYIQSATPASLALVKHAREMIVQAFAPLDPLTAQHQLDVAEFARLLGALKPAFIHHPTSKQLVCQCIQEMGADPTRTYYDVPRLRSSTSDDYLTTGIALAFPPHRDTWYAAPQCQINWWLPVYDIEPDNGMAFHPGYIDRAIANNSEVYNYYQWNKTRANTSTMIGKADTRVPPMAMEPPEGAATSYITECGGLTLFSGAQLHSSLPNRSKVTRYSIDFRTVNIDDLWERRGAPNADARCEGTSLRDYMRVSDGAPLPEDLVRQYDSGQVGDGLLVFKPEEAGSVSPASPRRG